MSFQDSILDATRFCFEGDFDTQIAHILENVRLTRDEVQNLRRLFIDLEQALQPIAPGCQVIPFGSIVTGLGIKTSDVDCFVALPNGMKPTKNIIIMAKNMLQRNRAIFAKLFAITSATVPIVKFLHIPTDCNCDVSFKSPAGIQNSKLIGHLLYMDKRALPMAVLIKYWSKVHKFTGTNLMPNYALTMLVIFYLQLKNIMPPICDLQQDVESYTIDNWESSFNIDMYHDTDNSDSLYELVGGFFKYYSNLNFEQTIISPFLGRVIDRKIFQNFNSVPKELSLYKQNLKAGLCKELRTETIMCVQDPFDHSRNCAVAIYPRLMETIKSHFRFAAKNFDECDEDSFLRAILTEAPATIKQTNPNKRKHTFVNKIMKHHHINRSFRNNLKTMYTEFNRIKRGKR